MLDAPHFDERVARYSERLLSNGYCVIPDLLPGETIAALSADLEPHFEATPFCRGRFYGERTKRFGRVLARSPHAAELVQHALVLGIVERILSPYCDTIQLNLTQAVEVHPGALAQMPHRDEDMWRAESGKAEYLVNIMWPFTPYRRGNGATRVWPGSHGGRMVDVPMEALAAVPEYGPGSALLILGSTLHAAGANPSEEVRRGLIVGYSLGWLRSYENQFLAYPPETARTFAPELAALIGYRQHRPNLGNFEGRCPSVLLGDTPPHGLGAEDALRPDQEAAVDDHAAAQRSATAR